MSITIGNFEIGKLKTGTREKSYWNEDDPRARYNAVSDALWIYRYRDLEQNLRRFGWRQARRKVLAQGALSREWTRRGRGVGAARDGSGGLLRRRGLLPGCRVCLHHLAATLPRGPLEAALVTPWWIVERGLRHLDRKPGTRLEPSAQRKESGPRS